MQYSVLYLPIHTHGFAVPAMLDAGAMRSFVSCNSVNWMYAMFLSNNKVSECKSGPFEHSQSMSKQPTGLELVGNFISYLLYLPAPFPRGI